MPGPLNTQTNTSRPNGAIALVLAVVLFTIATTWLGLRSQTADASATEAELGVATFQLEQARRDVVRSSLDEVVVRAGVFAGVLGEQELDRSQSERRLVWTEAVATAELVAENQPSLAEDAETLRGVIDRSDRVDVPDLFAAAGVAEFDVLDDPTGVSADQFAFVDNAFTLVLYEAFIARADQTSHESDLLSAGDREYLTDEIEFVALNPGYLGPDIDDPLAESVMLPNTSSGDAEEIAWRDEVSELLASSTTWSAEQWTIAWASGETDAPPFSHDELFAETAANVAIIREDTDARLTDELGETAATAASERVRAERTWIAALLTGALSIGLALAVAVIVARRLRRAGQLARTDELTGVGNRRRLDDVRGALADTAFTHHVVVVIDLDRFKLVNDTHGHLVGDRVLTEIARQLEALAHTSGVQRHEIIRLGGDEFAVTLHHHETVPIATLEAQLEAIQANAVTTRDGERVLLEFSAGIVESDGSSASLEDLLDAADLRAYQAKQRRRDRRSMSDEFTTRNQSVDLTN